MKVSFKTSNLGVLDLYNALEAAVPELSTIHLHDTSINTDTIHVKRQLITCIDRMTEKKFSALCQHIVDVVQGIEAEG